MQRLFAAALILIMTALPGTPALAQTRHHGARTKKNHSTHSKRRVPASTSHGHKKSKSSKKKGKHTKRSPGSASHGHKKSKKKGKHTTHHRRSRKRSQ